MIMYMFLSLLATIATEGLIFMGIYLYETEIIAGEYKKVWGASGQGKMSLGTFTMSQSVALDAWVIVIFTILLLVIYFILISNKFVMYVREIISGVERMKSGDLMEEIPVQGEDEFSEIAASINEMRQNLYETMESQKAVEKRIGRWFAGLPPAVCGRMLEAVKSAGDDPPASCAGSTSAVIYSTSSVTTWSMRRPFSS